LKNGFDSPLNLDFTQKMESLYILECEDNKWYVGKSTDVQRRFKQHTEGKGSEWTREYAPIRIAETRSITSQFDETNVTKEYMKKYGIDNVRGGAYATVELTDAQEDIIRHELRAANDSCYKCGKKGHFANKCPYEIVYQCEGCRREFPSEKQCVAHAQTCSTSSRGHSTGSHSKGVCYRCGRSGHWVSNCYARTDADGNALSDNENEGDDEDSDDYDDSNSDAWSNSYDSQ
jgi:predicted GIY-YIG superfamily endonuclease